MSSSNNKNDHKCRLCLVETEGDKMSELFSLNGNCNNKKYDTEEDEFSKMPLYQKVEYCCGVKLPPKPEMPSKICGKCVNIINMWSNFRQMCCNSQAFLASQISVTLEEETVKNNIKDLQQMRTELLKKTEQGKREKMVSINSSDTQIEIDYVVEDVDEADVNDFDDYMYGTENNDVYEDSDPDETKGLDISRLHQIDFSETFSPDDYAEAMEYLNAENDDELENFIEHCATKNVALQTLRRKAAASNKSEKAAAKKSQSNKKNHGSKKKDDSESQNKLMKPSMFMCNICGNVYSKKPLFQYHMRMHSDVKPYQCEICSKAYRIMSDLRNHMYRHTGERPFKCKFCDRHFMDRSSRHRHERVHTNSRPYSCNVCNKSFTYSAILKNHMKLHTGEKDYICAVCNKSFTLAHQLKAHMLTLTHREKEAAFEAQGYKVIFEAVEMTKAVKK